MNRKLKILVVYANHGGCSFYRALNPYQKLAQLYPEKVKVRFSDNPLDLDPTNGFMPPKESLVDMNWADVILINNILKFGGPYTARVCGIGKELNKFVHFDTDDLLTNLYEHHYLHGVYKDNKLDEITKAIYHFSDLVTVTQAKFARRIQPFCSKIIAVVRNAIDYDLPCWNQPKIVNKYTKIGWAGGIHHRRDLEPILGVPHLLNQKVGRENVKWNLYGCPPKDPKKAKDWQDNVWPEYLQKLLQGFKGQQNWQVYPALPPDQYGVYYSDMDIAIAPLEMNEFNDSKSDIKVAEAGRYKIPLVASNVGCYNETIVNGKTGYLIDPDAPKTEWVRILNKLCTDSKLRRDMGENLHAITEQHFDLKKVVGQRLDIYEKAFHDLGYNPQ
jgi:processive 1,2-diacylglycerol beta-glucosyltransferase